MGIRFSKNTKKKLDIRGDTIVEVLIAIAIAGFAIGISYATAQRSLDQAISAREHNEALNILENQATDLQVRFQAYASDPTGNSYNSIFANPGMDYCLDDSATKIGDTGWSPYDNLSGIDTSSIDTAKLASNSPPVTSKPYRLVPSAGPQTGCQEQRPGDGAIYYINIHTTNPNPTGVNSTLYYITVRWARLGGGVNRASLYYKLNYDPAINHGNASGVTTGPSCSGAFPWQISEDDKASPPRLALANLNGLRGMYASWPAAWTIDANCTYTITINTNHSSHSAGDFNQQMFVELCSDMTAATCSLTTNSASTLYQTGLTSDITSSAGGSYTCTFTLSSTPKYILFKHCSLWQTPVGTCATTANYVDSYDISITGN
jgi:type II secretory pathway pseudopilin PulG